MSVDLEKFLYDQHLIFDWVKEVIINYEKLSKANVTYDVTKSWLDDLEARWEEARLLDSNISYEATEEDRRMLPYFVQDQFSEAENAYYEAASYLIIALSKFNKAGIPEHEGRTDSSSSMMTELSLSLLPPIELPKFSGRFSEWKSFCHTFGDLVGSNNTISNMLKLYYLKSCVSGDAARLIDNLPLSDVNYSFAWEMLMDEYEHKRLLIYSHLESFVCFPVMKSESIVELRRLRHTVAIALAALTNLGSPVEQWDHIIVFIISLKFSPKTRREWFKSLGKSREYPSYKEMHEFLTIYIRELSRASDANPERMRIESRSSVKNVSATVCVNCNGSHNLARCEAFLSKSITQRNALVKKKQVCFNCLRPGHFISKCPSRSRCTHCRRMHHSLLHLAAATGLGARRVC